MKLNDDPQLRSLLREWQVPVPPHSLERRVLGAHRSWWRFLLSGSIRVPVPVACCLLLLMGAAAAWRSTTLAQPTAPRVVVKAERVEVPVVRERVITKVVYRNVPARVRPPEHDLTFDELKPVVELRPRIIRGGDAEN